MQEFARRGQGTPIPFDPPKHLVSSGVYAYLANPMQLSAFLMLVGWGVLLESGWVIVGGLVALIFSIGLAAWSEDGDLKERFGPTWLDYRQQVRNWWARWRPWYPADSPARLYVAESCGPCSELGRWLRRQQPRGLSLVAAESHPSQNLRRLTYDPADGTTSEEGVAALGRALEHIHLGFALLGWTLRLPVVCQFVQLITDAVGGGPRQLTPNVDTIGEPSDACRL